MREPLPMYCVSSAAYAQAARAGEDAATAGREAWTSRYKFDGEDAELEHQLVLGGVRSVDDLLSEPPQPTSAGRAGSCRRRSRFGRYALRMWDGLLSLRGGDDAVNTEFQAPAFERRRIRCPEAGDGPRGERRHRQDVRDRGTRRPLRRRRDCPSIASCS